MFKSSLHKCQIGGASEATGNGDTQMLDTYIAAAAATLRTAFRSDKQSCSNGRKRRLDSGT